MHLVPWEDDNKVVFYSSSEDYTDILEIWADRNGGLFAKITTPKDQVTTLPLGKVEVPPRLRKLGKNFKSEVTKWISEQMNGQFPILKFGAGNSYQLSFKLNGKQFTRQGKFRG